MRPKWNWLCCATTNWASVWLIESISLHTCAVLWHVPGLHCYAVNCCQNPMNNATIKDLQGGFVSNFWLITWPIQCYYWPNGRVCMRCRRPDKNSIGPVDISVNLCSYLIMCIIVAVITSIFYEDSRSFPVFFLVVYCMWFLIIEGAGCPEETKLTPLYLLVWLCCFIQWCSYTAGWNNKFTICV